MKHIEIKGAQWKVNYYTITKHLQGNRKIDVWDLQFGSMRGWILPLNFESRRRTLRSYGNKNYSNESSQCWVLSTDSFRNHHLCLLAWLLVTAEMSQHLASCLLLVLADLYASGHLQLVYEGVQSCQDFSTMRLHGYLRLLMCANSCWYFNSSLERVYTESERTW